MRQITRWSTLLLFVAGSLAAQTVRPVTGTRGGRVNGLAVAARRAAAAKTSKSVGPRRMLTLTGDTVLSHIVDGNYWSTEFTFTNLDSHDVHFIVYFMDDEGRDLEMPVVGQGYVIGMEITLSPMMTYTFETAGTDPDPYQGWAYVGKDVSTDRVAGFGVFRLRITGHPDYEAVVPLENEFYPDSVMLFDNTAGFSTGMAIANPHSNAADITVIVRDEDGAEIDRGTFTLGPYSHYSASLADPKLLPVTANRRGTVEFITTNDGITALGLRFNRTGPFTSFHVLTNVDWLQ